MTWKFRSQREAEKLRSWRSTLKQMDVSKNSGFSPQIIHFIRVFHYFHHPFWGIPIFGNTQIEKLGLGIGQNIFPNLLCEHLDHSNKTRCWGQSKTKKQKILSLKGCQVVSSHLSLVAFFEHIHWMRENHSEESSLQDIGLLQFWCKSRKIWVNSLLLVPHAMTRQAHKEVWYLSDPITRFQHGFHHDPENCSVFSCLERNCIFFWCWNKIMTTCLMNFRYFPYKLGC